MEDLPEFTDYCMRSRTYRYDDYSKDQILYPFGYGLTYSDISVGDVKLTDEGDKLIADITLSNSGMTGEDVVEVYFKSESKDAVKNHALCAFKRVRLEKGETSELRLEILKKNLTVVSNDGVRYLDSSAPVTLYFGTSQPDELSCRLTGKSAVAKRITL